MASLEIEKLRGGLGDLNEIFLQNPGAASSGLGRAEGYVGYRTDELQLAGGAEYGNRTGDALADFNSKAQTVLNELSGLVGMEGVSSNFQFRIQTRHYWTGSQRPSVPINLTFVRWSMKDPPVNLLAAELVSFTLPSNPSRSDKDMLLNPGNYKPGSDGNTWNLRVGKMLKVDKLLMTSASATLSQQVVSDGTPLFATVQMAFEPTMVPGAEEFISWSQGA